MPVLNKSVKSASTWVLIPKAGHTSFVFECLSDLLKASRLAGLSVDAGYRYLIDAQTVETHNLTQSN